MKNKALYVAAAVMLLCVLLTGCKSTAGSANMQDAPATKQNEEDIVDPEFSVDVSKEEDRAAIMGTGQSKQDITDLGFSIDVSGAGTFFNIDTNQSSTVQKQ